MTTNEERRALASRIRAEAAKGEIAGAGSYVMKKWLEKQLGMPEMKVQGMPTLRDMENADNAFLMRLAEYIEPQPERMCRVKKLIPHEPFCSECAAYIDPEWNYCPNCGARITV